MPIPLPTHGDNPLATDVIRLVNIDFLGFSAA